MKANHNVGAGVNRLRLTVAEPGRSTSASLRDGASANPCPPYHDEHGGQDEGGDRSIEALARVLPAAYINKRNAAVRIGVYHPRS